MHRLTISTGRLIDKNSYAIHTDIGIYIERKQ